MKPLKRYEITFFDRYGEETSITVRARGKIKARYNFIREYGYYLIINIKELPE